MRRRGAAPRGRCASSTVSAGASWVGTALAALLVTSARDGRARALPGHPALVLLGRSSPTPPPAAAHSLRAHHRPDPVTLGRGQSEHPFQDQRRRRAPTSSPLPIAQSPAAPRRSARRARRRLAEHLREPRPFARWTSRDQLSRGPLSELGTSAPGPWPRNSGSLAPPPPDASSPTAADVHQPRRSRPPLRGEVRIQGLRGDTGIGRHFAHPRADPALVGERPGGRGDQRRPRPPPVAPAAATGTAVGPAAGAFALLRRRCSARHEARLEHFCNHYKYVPVIIRDAPLRRLRGRT